MPFFPSWLFSKAKQQNKQESNLEAEGREQQTEINSIEGSNPIGTVDFHNMECSKGIDSAAKRIRKTEEKGENMAEIVEEQAAEEETETNVAGSEEMEIKISRVLERIERYTQQVSELLEAGKAMFKDLSAEFEERMITIHREQIEKWQDEIKELRSLDAFNEEASNRLRNAHYLLQNVQMES